MKKKKATLLFLCVFLIAFLASPALANEYALSQTDTTIAANKEPYIQPQGSGSIFKPGSPVSCIVQARTVDPVWEDLCFSQLYVM
ncbi:hypothetical protein [Desulfitobacterium hafniense]|uniref:hypothetical protein n=1 Tax=Desulfitobacterium hafniense TaxID=49338 RepID=UPI00036FFAA5|nr:hypothetical protein [Desulfitobacterium hafniense]